MAPEIEPSRLYGVAVGIYGSFEDIGVMVGPTVYGLVWSMYAPSFVFLAAFLTQLVPARVRGTFLGVHNSCTFIGAATGPLIFGYIVDVAGFSAFFTLALSLFVSATLVALPILRAGWWLNR